MKCPNCGRKTDIRALQCADCGQDLSAERKRIRFEDALIIFALLQAVSLSAMIVLLSNGSAAAYFLKRDQLDKAEKIASVFHSAAESEKFLSCFKDKTDREVNAYLNGEKRADTVRYALEAYQFPDTADPDRDSTIYKINAKLKEDSEYIARMDIAAGYVKDEDYDQAIRFYQFIIQDYPDRQEQTESALTKAENQALSHFDTVMKNLQKDIAAGKADVYQVTDVYHEQTVLLEQISEQELPEHYAAEISSRIKQYYKDWLQYNLDNEIFTGIFTAFDIAKICEKKHYDGAGIADVNKACIESCQRRAESGEGYNLYQDIIEIKKRLPYEFGISYSDYTPLLSQAGTNWMNEVREEYCTAVNQEREKAGCAKLEYSEALENAAAAIVENPLKEKDDDFIQQVLSQYYPGWQRAVTFYQQYVSSAEDALSWSVENQGELIYSDDLTQIGIGLKLDPESQSMSLELVAGY